MFPNPVSISRRTTPLLFRCLTSNSSSVKPFSHFGKIPQHTFPFQISSFRSCRSSCINSQRFPCNSRWAIFKDFRVSAVSDGRLGGTGGYGGSGGGDSFGKGEGGGGGGGSGGGGPSNWSLLSWYLNLLEKHPVLTKAGTSAFLTFIGDVICQVMIDQVPSLDWKRTFLFTLLGLVLVGPTLHFWYLYLSKLVRVSGASGAFLRLLLDQFLFAPTFIGVFLSTLLTLEGRPSEVVPKLQQEWFSSVLANWQLWIPFQFLNFRFVPQQFQVLAANVIALVWNVILSYKAHKELLPK